MKILALLVFALAIVGNLSAKSPAKGKASSQKNHFISEAEINKMIDMLIKSNTLDSKFRIEKGVKQTADFWTEKDGSIADWQAFVKNNFIADANKLDALYKTVETNWEVVRGYFNKMNLDLNRKLHLNIGEITPIDEVFGAWNPSAHLADDMFANKFAFHILLNFPYYSLEEKNANIGKWSQKEWAYARVADMFTSRVPALLNQKMSAARSATGNYIAEYYIYMGKLQDENGKSHFPADMKLISHWNLRDELKSHYGKADGLNKQKMVYNVMQRIIEQSIPSEVINKNKYSWNPETNKVYDNGKEIKFTPEANNRYQHILNVYSALKEIDNYSPSLPTYIDRKFEQEMELPQAEVEQLFVDFVSSPVVKDVAALIKSRLGRDLQPFDIWYDGFKARSGLSEEELNKLTKSKYKTPEDFKKELPTILTKLGFDNAKADYIASQVEVDPSRGAGHAWGAEMKGISARLRTHIKADGMDYKGYNIAVHEFGHNVEQTISLNFVPYYFINGVPNNAFTEAMAFVFQQRDLDLLGIQNSDPNRKHNYALDNFWATYEIMGVSLVDMRVWKWLYANPKANKEELNKAVNSIAKDVWNAYYAPVFGVKDSPILAIYSHMIDYPLYLAAYPIGHLIEFQIEKQIEGKNLASEIERMCKIGKLTPTAWMKQAVGSPLSPAPLINSAKEALKHVK